MGATIYKSPGQGAYNRNILLDHIYYIVERFNQYPLKPSPCAVVLQPSPFTTGLDILLPYVYFYLMLLKTVFRG
jgi:hypothetical protein